MKASAASLFTILSMSMFSSVAWFPKMPKIVNPAMRLVNVSKIVTTVTSLKKINANIVKCFKKNPAQFLWKMGFIYI